MRATLEVYGKVPYADFPYLRLRGDLMREFIVEGSAHGRPVKVRVFAQNHHDAVNQAKVQTGDPHMTVRKTTEV